jgi:hypothetical protein
MNRTDLLDRIVAEISQCCVQYLDSGQLTPAELECRLILERKRLAGMSDVQLIGVWELNPELLASRLADQQ